jgi:UDP-galactopyranose mutase
VVVARVGRDLYEKFFRGYTRKQWGLDPSQLDKAVTSRVPVRTNRDDRYFTDRFQAMPKHGYTAMFRRMLQHRKIQVLLQADYREVRAVIPHRRVIFTGPIDEYFSYRFGRLPYRSLRFEHMTKRQSQFQPVGVVNYPLDRDYTRITEYKYLTGQHHPWTALTYEYPTDKGDPYYPVPRAENQALYKQYEGLARGGRRLVRRAVGDVSLLQYGSSGRAGVGYLQGDRKEGTSCRERSGGLAQNERTPGRSISRAGRLRLIQTHQLWPLGTPSVLSPIS